MEIQTPNGIQPEVGRQAGAASPLPPVDQRVVLQTAEVRHFQSRHKEDLIIKMKELALIASK